MKIAESVIELSGRESALVTAALFALVHWPFEVASAKAMASPKHQAEAERVGDAVSARWREILIAAELWSTGPKWTRRLIAQRAALKPALSLSPAELPITIIALDAVAKEFSSRWGEFCIVVPGALDWYPIKLQDAEELATRLKSTPFP